MMISMYSLSLYIIVYFTGFGLVWFGLVDRNLAIKRTGNTTLRVQAPFVGVTKIGVVGRIAVHCSTHHHHPLAGGYGDI